MKMHETRRRRNHGAVLRWGGCAAALLALTALTASQAQETGRCARVDTPWPVLLPDGSVHEPSTLKLCLKLKLNPVTGIHDIKVNGISGGMVRSKIGKSEGRTTDDPVVVFQRTEDGPYALVGYAWPDGPAMKTFGLYDLAGGQQATARAERMEVNPFLTEEAFVLLVARRLE